MSHKNKGILLIICSAFCFALMNVFVRLSGDLPSIQKSFFRNFVALIFAFIMIRKNHVPLRLERQNWVYMILRSTFGTIGILCNFYAVDHLMVSDASMLNKLSPFFVIIFSFLLLKEKVKPYQAICVIIAFLGSLFVIKPGFSMSAAPALIGACGGLCAGLAYTYVRMLGSRGVKGPLIVFCFSSFSCLVTLPSLLLDYHPMSGAQILCLLGAGLAASGGQFSITAAYTFAPARDISIYDYSQIIFATILSFVILGQIPDVYSFIGYAIIISASLAMFLRRE
ncbi:DMT family transporter [Hespellia stercorisuis]|uniref:Permease of the drug/metabolite transporter (DMT) superfamily n=1 Tax=Hespellia stercorisuis DSM 15480 TaxID=1121950 RepID=A0A1M6MD40_9FIRM|nr:DMT family transporter [Hespellia stercorisuis]SHJ81402.1 Permease of the drug/metabolite transporter (DMT) superfamily [Hespellia stercorisuis DSM 15480]